MPALRARARETETIVPSCNEDRPGAAGGREGEDSCPADGLESEGVRGARDEALATVVVGPSCNEAMPSAAWRGEEGRPSRQHGSVHRGEMSLIQWRLSLGCVRVSSERRGEGVRLVGRLEAGRESRREGEAEETARDPLTWALIQWRGAPVAVEGSCRA